MTLFLDMDGVLADFDKRAHEVLGMDCAKFEFRFGSEELWKRLNAVPDFFLSFDPMPDAGELFEAVHHLKPEVLTALPHTGAADVRRQKLQWIKDWMSDEWVVHTCLTRQKPNFCQSGDILVDDRNINEREWIGKDGIFIHHFSAKETIAQLKELGVI